MHIAQITRGHSQIKCDLVCTQQAAHRVAADVHHIGVVRGLGWIAAETEIVRGPPSTQQQHSSSARGRHWVKHVERVSVVDAVQAVKSWTETSQQAKVCELLQGNAGEEKTLLCWPCARTSIKQQSIKPTPKRGSKHVSRTLHAEYAADIVA